MDIPKTLRNIVVLLQADPLQYRCFGVYWWPIKALLKAAGYTREQLPMLGAYEDAAGAALVPKADLQTTMGAALEEYAMRVRYSLGSDECEIPNDGGTYVIRDDDAPA